MSITIEAQATRTLIQQDGVSIVAINDNGSMELLTPPSFPTGNMVTTFNQFGNSLSANGYQKLPSGLIIQWGTSGSLAGSGSVTVTLPIAYPTAGLNVQCQRAGSTTGSTHGAVNAVFSSLSQIIIRNGSTDTLTPMWMSFGY